MNTKAYKKDFSSIGIRMLVCTAVILLLQVGAQSLALTIFPQQKDSFTFLLVATMLPLYVLGFPFSFALMRNKDVPSMEKRTMTPGQLLIAFLMCYGIMFVGNVIGLGLTSVIGLIKGSPVQNAILDVISGGPLWITAIFTVLCAPVCEEVLFRKLICDKVIKYGEGCAIVLSGLIFGLFHMNFNQFFYAFFLGCFFAFIYIKTGSLKYSIILHMAINFFGSVLGGIILTMDQTKPYAVAVSAVYSLCIYAIAIAGIVLLIRKRKTMTLAPGEIVIEKGQRFKTMILNAGMSLYCLVLLAIIILQAFAI